MADILQTTFPNAFSCMIEFNAIFDTERPYILIPHQVDISLEKKSGSLYIMNLESLN